MKGITLLFCTMILLNVSAGNAHRTGDPTDKKKHIKGVVIDAKKKTPLPYANIVLKKLNDSALVSGTYSGNTGEFILPNIPEGKYTLRISLIGHSEQDISTEISGTANEIDLGLISLEEVPVEVEGTTVERERLSEEFHLDKKVINVSQSLQSTGGTALDVLRNQSSINIDADDNVRLRGSAQFTVLVNGRPGIFQGADALKQVPANLIESIELITNPSAKYDAEGSAGIINIILKKQNDITTSAIANLGAGSRDKYNGDVTSNVTIGAVTLTGGLDYRRTTSFQTQEINRLTSTTAGDMTNATIFRRRDIRDQYTIRLGMDYKANESSLISLSGSHGEVKIPRNFEFDIHNVSPQSNDYLLTLNRSDVTATFNNMNMFYNLKIIPGASELSAEAFYTNLGMPYEQNTNEYRSDATFSSQLPEPNSLQTRSTNTRNEGRIKLNYIRTFSQQSAFECGIQTNFSYRGFDVRYTQYDWQKQAWLTDTTMTNKYDMRNNVYAAFATYSDEIFSFDVQAGLRAEYMDRLLSQKTIGGNFQYDRLDLFPSFSVSRKFEDHQLQFSYSRRITRPIEVYLNPFPYYTDTYLTSAGNPRLLPEYVNSFELNYMKPFGDIFLTAQTYLRASTDVIWQTQTADESGKLTTQFSNFAKTTAAGAEITLSMKIASWLKLDPNINVYNYTMNGTSLDQQIDLQSFEWTARLNTTMNFSPSTRVQITGMYMGRQSDPQSNTDPVFLLSVSGRQDFFNRAFSVTVQAQNLLTTAYYNTLSRGGNFRNTFLVKPEIPIVNLTLSYNFNNYKRPSRPTEGVDVNVGG